MKFENDKEYNMYQIPIARKYANEYLHENNHTIFFHVNHELGDIIAFHNLVSHFFYKSVFIVIPYNISEFGTYEHGQRCENCFKIYRDENRYYVYHNEKLVTETKSDIVAQMRDLFISALRNISDDIGFKKILILEDGGYHYSVFREIMGIFPGLEKNLVGCVEQTRNGLRSYFTFSEINPVNYPVVTVARSKIKMRIESYFIAQSAAVITNKFLELLGDSLVNSRVAVIGYGTIGRHLVEILDTFRCRQWIIENDDFICKTALSEGRDCAVVMNKIIFEKDLIIIGTTGNASFTKDMLEMFFQSKSELLTLVSISSKQTEFKYFFEISKQYEYNVHDIQKKGRYLGKEYIFFIQRKIKKVRLFGDGYPINFFCTWRPGIPLSVMDMIYAEMIYSIGIFFKSEISLRDTLYMIGDSIPCFEKIENKIFEEWISMANEFAKKGRKNWINFHPCEEYLRYRI